MVAEVSGKLLPSSMLVRRLTAEDGPVEAIITFDPRLGAQHRPPRTQHRGAVLVYSWSTMAIALRTTPTAPIEPGVSHAVTVTPDRPLTSVMTITEHEPLVYVEPDVAWDALKSDELRWQAWCRGIDPRLPHRDAVVRSLLTRRLLTYSPSGAPVAAPTTSLPEVLGGVRNWDYRYASRRVLLDALTALKGRLDNLILVGVQAVYHHADDADLNVPLLTTDGDLAQSTPATSPKYRRSRRSASLELREYG